MISIDSKDLILLFGAALIAIAFSLMANFLIQLFIRRQVLLLDSNQITPEAALIETNTLLNRIGVLFIIMVLFVTGFLIFGYLFPITPFQSGGNVTNIYENCSFPTSNIINYNYYNITLCDNYGKYLDNQMNHFPFERIGKIDSHDNMDWYK